ncbi:HD domain-containing protein [Candidatus Minimicrobia naudis]|uniref:HD domain-containing protein n=1 Tax=Candidatus Minimicrobia naudis TaxID=2841263 RepID=A0A8F1SB28_9BACT|nr:HD domain-containing protein [Candidatus Minimicrobia naudis]
MGVVLYPPNSANFLPTASHLSASNPHQRSSSNWRIIQQHRRPPNSPTIHQFIPPQHASIMKNSPKFIRLSDSRLFHMRGVAYKSYNLAREVFNMEEDVARSLFVMGLTHDFAYPFVENQTRRHEHEGGRILKLSGFNWAEAVFNHGDPDVENWTDEVLILNLANMTTSPDGKPITTNKLTLEKISKTDMAQIAFRQQKRLQIKQTNQRRTHQTKPNNPKLINPKVNQNKNPRIRSEDFYSE